MCNPRHTTMFIVPNSSNPIRALLLIYFIKTQSNIARPVQRIITIQLHLQHYHQLCYSISCHLYVTNMYNVTTRVFDMMRIKGNSIYIPKSKKAFGIVYDY